MKQQMKQIVASLQRKRPDQDTCAVPLGSAFALYSLSSSGVALCFCTVLIDEPRSIKVVFLGLFEKSYPQQLAVSFLSDLKKEFCALYDDHRVRTIQVCPHSPCCWCCSSLCTFHQKNSFALMEFDNFVEKRSVRVCLSFFFSLHPCVAVRRCTRKTRPSGASTRFRAISTRSTVS
jgi:hypothetical protein